MEKVLLEVGDKLKVELSSVGGDLRLSGRKESRFEVQAPDDGDLKVEQDGDRIAVSCRSGCLIYLPSTAAVEVNHIGGDARVTRLSADLLIRNVGGDVSLSRVGRASFETIGADLTARKVSGDLSVDLVGGDAFIEKVEGDVRLRTVGGDLVLRQVQGLVDVSVGGDASVDIVPHKGKRSSVSTGSDLSCRLPEDASLTIELQVGGDLRKPAHLQVEDAEQGRVLQLGDGEGTLGLSVGGDLWLRVGAGEVLYTDEILGDLEGRIEASVAEVEARVAAMVEGAYSFDAERIGERVRRSVARARRRAERAQKTAARHRHAHGLGRGIFPSAGSAQESISDEERMAILRMVEQGKISVEEAEKLLKALEGDL